MFCSRELHNTYLLTPWCRVLLEKLTGLQLVKKFPAFHGTRRFITALTSERHLSLSWASPIQSIYPHPTSCRSTLCMLRDVPLEPPPPGDPSGGVVYLLTSELFCLQSKQTACECFLTYVFYREGLLAPRPTPKLEDHTSSAVRDCLFNLFAATLLIGGRGNYTICDIKSMVSNEISFSTVKFLVHLNNK